MKKIISLFLFLSIAIFAQEKISDARTAPNRFDSKGPIVYTPNTADRFFDDMNLAALTDLTTRGWTWINQDGGGSTTASQGNPANFVAYEGPTNGYCGQNYQGANGLIIDQWLISPQVQVAVGDTLSFWYRSIDSGSVNYDDSIYVRLAPMGGNTIADFTTNLGLYKVPYSPWTNWKYVFTAAGNIRFAIQYYIVDGGVTGANSNYWGLDLVQVKAGPNPVPVELTSFVATQKNSSIELNWSTATEINNKGFEIEKSVGNNVWQNVSFVAGKGTTTEKQNYLFVDNNLVNGKYSYRLKQVDFDGKFNYSAVVNAEITQQPTTFALDQNFPNPFNPSTSIRFFSPSKENVKLDVYNQMGQLVASLLNKEVAAGFHEVQFNASDFASGVYFYQIKAGSFSSIKKMILMK